MVSKLDLPVEIRASPLTLSALRCVTRTTSGALPLPSLTVRMTKIFTGMTRPPTSAAQPRPRTRLQSISPVLESIPNTLPNGVAATIICLKPNASRHNPPICVEDAAGNDTDAYDPVANRLTKLTRYSGKSWQTNA